ncbi:Uncharacterised protein [Actinomyces bovis]|uniref:Uncharacterized protein n=1 Tax=Actinomyces bovis TaxID=1658 RepID=A0ABY1VKK5_9ACTO|nr:hypothetical protein [Actinomyces bovis]SPT52550.1 Uncharacterised protein [Actinomyces bovis]VEG54314.1 Uncharacterised protein [Actinomyces israelii]
MHARPRVYGNDLMSALLRAEGEITVSDAQTELLAQISAATIDRMLAGERSKMTLRNPTYTKPGSLLKHQIPIHTFANWDNDTPGFVQIDLVAHDGDIASGEYRYTLTMTSIASWWTVNRSVPERPCRRVVEATDHAAGHFLFPFQGIESDNVTVRQPSPAPRLPNPTDRLHPAPGGQEERRLRCRAEELDQGPGAGWLLPL